MEKPRSARSSKWGQACAPCAAAKARCIRSGKFAGTTCDRCHSLDKTCSSQVQGPRKKRQPKPSKATQVVEERLNRLIQSLNARGEGDSTPSSIVTSNESDEREGGHVSSPITIEPGSHDSSSQEEPVLHAGVPRSSSGGPPSCTCKEPMSKADLVPSESDETLLSIYINQLSPHFPFVVIPPGTTAKHLHETRPFLMRVVRMVASVRHLRSMRGQSRAVFKHVFDAMLIRSERSLDLLQGILLFLGFYQYFCMSHAHYNNLTHLAVSLVGDMELSTCPNLKAREKSHRLILARAEEPRPRTNEERRAILGVWYMSSNAALVVKQMGQTRYTKYLDQCLRELESTAEHETDQLAVQLVRIQHLTEKIFYFHADDQLVNDLPGVPKTTAAAYLEAFQTELDRLRTELSPKLKNNDLLVCHYNSAYLRLFAPFVADAQLLDTVPHPFTSLSHSGLSPLDMFAKYTAALKTWFNDWLTVPVCSYFYLPQPVFSQLIHASRNIVQWARLSGPSAAKFSSSGILKSSSSRKENTPLHPLPAFGGIPSCPELVVPQPSTSVFDPTYPAQATLDLLRAEVFAQPELWFDVLGIVEAAAVRFEAAKKEMAAAHGGVWENEIWDAAAQQMWMKKARIEKWFEMAGIDKEKENQPLLLDPPGYGGEAPNLPGWESSGRFESSDDPDNWQWASDMFAGIDRDIAFFDIPENWSAEDMMI